MAKRTCRKCSECDHDEPRHHWIDDGDNLTGWSCKHCEAIAVECMACAGTGDGDYLLGDNKCEACHGEGIVEVVAISLEEVERLRGMAALANRLADQR